MTPLSVDQVLGLNEHDLVLFVKDNLTDENGALNISNITGWADVSQATRDRLAERLLTAIQKAVAPSVDPLELATLLARIPSDRSSPSPHTTRQYASSSRSSTIPPLEDEEYQARCYQALLDDGCRPLFPLSLLPQVSTDPDAYRDMLRPWTEYPDTPSPQDWAVFSRQLCRWKEYRAWQLVNRRLTVVFSEYLNEERRHYEMMGAYKVTADPDFEQEVHRQWENEWHGGRGRPPRDDDDAEAVLSRYAAEASRIVMDYGFVQPFQLQADPKQQDQWTTFVEYLAFECFRLGKLTPSVRKLRPQHDAEWEKLVKAGVVGPRDTCDDLASTEARAMRLRELDEAAFAARVRSFTAATGTTTTTTARKTSKTPPTNTWESLQSAQIHLEDITRRNKLVDEYLHNTKKYRSAKAEADHQQRMVEWVLSEISEIEAEQKAAGKSSGSGGAGSRKRKRTTDDVIEARVGKQRRRDETEKTVASGSDNARTTRSKKRNFPADDGTMEPQFKTENMAAGEGDGPGTRSRKRSKARGIHDTDGSAAAPRGVPKPRSGAATTNSRPRRHTKRMSLRDGALGSRADRLATLRPRVNNKAVVGVSSSCRF
ncbi:hypothetical protein QBC45DRAFT_31931 [Copromyces sp. CBS 386.78]|nr:hypothetical protein QBC45DRAFT_31931 [Copromyces sp. CBS 386.78]